MTAASFDRIAPPKIAGVSLWQAARRRLVRNRAAMGGLAALIVVALLAAFGPFLSANSYEDVLWDMPFSAPPDFAHGLYFGTDANGRDLFVRTLYGARLSLTIGIVSALVSLVIGVAYGATAGFLGGTVDSVMMRIVDTIYSLPFIFFVILLTTYFGRNIYLIFVAIGAVEWLDMARIVRGQTMALKHREFIEAAHAFGVSDPAIIRRHIIPNMLGPVVVFLTLTVPKVILLESFLSFLGLGVQEPMTSWGVLLADGAHAMETAPHMLFFPAIFLTVTLFSLNFLGDGLRDALDPKDR